MKTLLGLLGGFTLLASLFLVCAAIGDLAGGKEEPGIMIGLMVFFGGTAIGWTGVFLAEVARLAGPAKAGEITGATAVFTFAGPLLGPSLFSLILLLTHSYAIAFCTMGVFTLIGAILLIRDARHEHASLRQVMESAL